MFIKKKNKVKKTIDFEFQNLEWLDKYEIMKENNISIAEKLNYIINLFSGLDPSIKEKLRKYCYSEYKKLDCELMEEVKKLEPFAREEKKRSAEQYKKLEEFFMNHKDENRILNEKYMKRIDIEDGYVIVPDDWIILCKNKAKNCRYVGVIEFKNGAEYNAPHFIFFSDKPINELTDREEDNIHKSICEEFPKYKYIFNKYIPLIFGKDKKALNMDEHLKSPIPGCFQIAEYGERDFFPFGAIVYRYYNKY